MSRLFKLTCVLTSLTATLLFTSCGKEGLYQELDEPDANEILVVLFQNGIEADKLIVEGTQEVTYSVTVPKKDIQKARKVLVDNNLPRKKELGFSGICKEKGLIPTPEEEKCRRLLALKGEIINSLERIPGVVDADVVLNIPEISEFATPEEVSSKKTSASAVIRVKKNMMSADLQESRVQRFISNSVENLDPRDVAVIISLVSPPEEALAEGPKKPLGPKAGPIVSPKSLTTIVGLTLSVESLKRFKIYAVGILMVLLGISAALILNVIKLTKMRQELKVFRAQGGQGMAAATSTPLLEEGSQAAAPQLQSGEGERAPGSKVAP
jgi:type III secretion protein J